MDCLFIDSLRMLLSTAVTCGPTVSAMTEPPRPPGAGNPDDPTAPSDPYAANDPGPGSAPPPPPPYGYGTPPPGNAQYGYAPPPSDPQYGFPPQPGYAPSADDKTWVLITHFGGAAGSFVSTGVLGWVVPLIAMLAKGNQSPVVRAEAVKALNFQLLWSLVAFIGWLTFCIGIGIVIFLGAMVISIVFGVIAGVKASNNEPYNYPLTYSLIK